MPSQKQLDPTRLTPCGDLIATASDLWCHAHQAAPTACDTCTDYSAGLNELERTRSDAWAGVMGYHRPVNAVKAGKQAEHAERVAFREPGKRD